MKYINKLCLCIATLVSFSCLGMMHQVIRDENGFRVFDGQQEHMVKPYFVDSLLKRMNPEQVQRFIERGNRIRTIRLSDGEYRLQAMVPVKGGGPILATALAVIGYPAVAVASLGTAIGITVATGDPKAGLTAGAAIATGGTAVVTKAIVVAAAAPTP